MTTAPDLGVRTSAGLLYLSMDLGDRPGLEEFGRNVGAVLDLASHATFVAELSTFPVTDELQPRVVNQEAALARMPDAGVAITRTSLASPWVTVLTDIARTSAPVGYGLAVTYGLHSLLKVVMTWQQHRQAMDEGNIRLEALREELRRRSSELVEQADPPQAGMRSLRAGGVGAEVAAACADMADIQAVEFIDPDDPRAAGEQPT